MGVPGPVPLRLGRRHRIDKIVLTSRGFKLHSQHIVRDYGQAVARCIRNGQPEVFVDNPHCLEFEYRDWATKNQTQEALRVLQALGGTVPDPSKN